VTGSSLETLNGFNPQYVAVVDDRRIFELPIDTELTTRSWVVAPFQVPERCFALAASKSTASAPLLSASACETSGKSQPFDHNAAEDTPVERTVTFVRDTVLDEG
jgi:hypothetical protein